jgi:lipid II:glycine glycyltransferase (peptidoglycan interpeptide bridge formation enzyme)
MIRALRVCYGTERRLLVRVKVNAYDDVDGGVLKDAMVQEGFCLQPSIQPYRTLLVDLQRSADELRQSSRRTWRQALAAAERSKVALVEGVGSDLIEEAIRVYEEMRRRKRFAPVVDMRKLAGMQVRLPADQRIRVILASFQQETVGALAYSSLGDTGLPLLAATADKGIRINSSYVMWWRMLLEMKDLGCRWCDLGGIDPVRTPGTYVFRAGIAAKSSRDVRALGVFDFSASRLTSALVFLGTQAQQAHRRIRARASAVANRWRRPSRGSPRGGETA